MTIRLVAATLVVTLLAYLTSPVVPILPVLIYGSLVAISLRGQQKSEESVVVAENDESNEVIPDPERF